MATHSINRRDFINGMLVVGAVLPSAALAGRGGQAGTTWLKGQDKSDDFSLCHKMWDGALTAAPAAAGPLHECLIIGGGMSGLVTAWQLQRLGVKDFLLLEKNPEPGGLCAAERINGISAARASAYPSLPFNADMRALYLDLDFVRPAQGKGVIRAHPDYVLKPPYDQVFIKGNWLADAFETDGINRLPISPAARNDFSRLMEALDGLYEWEDRQGRAALDCPVEKSSPAAKVRRLDQLTLGDYCREKNWSLELIRLFDPLLKSAYGLGHDRISAWAALDLLADELLPADPGEAPLGFPGGNGFFAARLAGRIPAAKVVTGAMVTRIVARDREVRVTVHRQGVAETLRARTAVFAAPQFMAPYLMPELPAERRKAAESFEYAAYVVANVAVTQTPPRLAFSNQMVGEFLMSDFLVADWLRHPDPRAASPERPNVLTAYCPLPASDRNSLLEREVGDWQTRILGEFDQCLPKLSRTVTAFHLHRWGHAFAVPTKGSIFSPGRQLAGKPLGRVCFAHADVEGIPTIDHAMASGFRAAREVARLLS